MYNELFSIGPVTIYGYGLMIAIGVLAAYWNTERLAKKAGLDPEPVFNILIIGVGFGIRDGASAAAVASVADGVVVGSVLVDQIAAHLGEPEQARAGITAIIRDMRAAMDR